MVGAGRLNYVKDGDLKGTKLRFSLLPSYIKRQKNSKGPYANHINNQQQHQAASVTNK